MILIHKGHAYIHRSLIDKKRAEFAPTVSNIKLASDLNKDLNKDPLSKEPKAP